MSTELQIILAVLGPAAAAAGAWGGVRYYFGKLEAKVSNCESRLSDHDERIKYVERHPMMTKR